MSRGDSKAFDCVQSMRQARDKLSSEIEGLSYEELVQRIRGRRYADPNLLRLAEEAAQQAAAAHRDTAAR